MTMSSKKKLITKKAALIIMMAVLLLSIFSMTVIATQVEGDAETFYNIRINYVFKDGTPAHDAYVATFREGDAVDLTVTNPSIDGFVPMTAPTGGVSAASTAFNYASLQNNVTETVYYIAGLTPYRVMYYKQNIYDDLYTRDNTVAEQYTNRYGYTGSNPTELETEALFDGFTNLFHEPDSIAADGSTVFRVYYDRNYYTVLFDLGENGYGVEPVYAKYQSVYHVTEPKRLGYKFLGWAHTDADSSKGKYGVDWHYIDENGNIISEETALASENLLQLTGDQVIPAHDTYYKAIWQVTNSRYSIIYWLQNANDDDYTVIAAKDIENVPSGSIVSYNDVVSDYDFFSFNLSSEFPTMSADQIAELNGMGKYFELNEEKTKDYENQFDDDGNTYIKGNGTSRISVFYDRKEITQRFFYARKTDAGKYEVLGNTKGFSNAYGAGTLDKHLGSDSSNNKWMELSSAEPQIASKYADRIQAMEYYSAQNKATYYYYEMKTKYYANQRDTWLLDAIDPLLITKNKESGIADPDYARFGAWTVEYGTEYYYSHKSSNNYTVKGLYERLDKQLLYRDSYLSEPNAQNPYVSDPLTLNYMAFWVNAKNADWNKQKNFLNFTYKNYVEILRIEYDENGDWNGQGGYIDTFKNPNTGRIYGLLPENVIETFDAGTQYGNVNTRDQKVKENQTAAALVGYTLVTDAQAQAAGLTNPKCEWFDKDFDGDGTIDFNSKRHCDVSYFYRRNEHNVKFRNNNVIDKTIENVFYGRPLEDLDYTPTFNNPPELADYYSFAGWYYTPYYFRQADFTNLTMTDDDMTFYAKWMPKEINVSFYPTYNDYYSDVHHLDDEEHMVCDTFKVNYGDYIPVNKIPVNDDDEYRPRLTPPAEGALFAGWYYLRNNVPVRFEPENIPVTALNKESGGQDAHLRLYAEWVTKDVGKYKISYVEKDNPDVEVADYTVGRAFVWKTRTFNAKSGVDLNEDHAWTEDGVNWWPTVNSHSLIIKANSQGHEYAPNEFTFEYIQKHGVHYRVEYLDADSRKPLLDPVELGKDDIYSTHGSIKEDAPFIPGYVAEKMSQTMILSASTKETAEEQRAEELETNVITFYYNKNDAEYLYEVEYYTQNIDDDGYTLFNTENLEVAIADDPETPEVEQTTVSLANLFDGQFPHLFISNGFTRIAGATKVTVTGTGGASSTTTVPDDANIPITATEKTTIKIYYNRNLYPYTVKYVDYHAERKYLDTPENEREGMWDGVMETHPGATQERVEKEISVSAPQDLTYDSHPYTRINNQDLSMTIAPVTESNPNINTIKVYYKQFYERELEYKMVCVNNNELTDYSIETGDPLFGGLSLTDQTVNSYDDIANVTFYSFNNAKAPGTNTYLHDHHYTFLGWYSTQTYDPDHPELNRLSTDEILSKDELGINSGLPARDTTYYALVKQDTVKAYFEFRYVEEDLPIATDDGDLTVEEADDLAAEIVRDAPSDPNGDMTGSKFVFTDPSDYVNNTEIMWRRSEGYSLSIQPKDDRVYKYEFAEWWEEKTNKTTGATSLIRHYNYNDTTWGASIERQLDRKEDKHMIAVFKRRNVTELPYTINYVFKSRIGNTDEERTKTFVKKGTLYADQGDLVEGVEGAKITTDGDYRLTDSFILENSPFESNHGETLLWSNSEGCIEKTSAKGKAAESDDNNQEISSATVDHTIATITAKQSTKTVFANYRMNSDEAYGNEPIVTFYGANHALDPQMKALRAPDSYNGMSFSYWAVRKSAKNDADIVAKSYDPLFDLCMMDNYWLTPVYEGAASGPGSKSATLDVTTHNIAQGNEDWIAWTWNEGEDGVWVRPDSNMTFNGLNDKVKFVRVPAGTSVTGGVWDETFEANVWNYTEDDDVDVQDGGTLILTDYYHDNSKKIAGEWSNNEPQETDPAEDPIRPASETRVTMAHLDYSRNRWTDEDGNINPSGETDLLFSDFEIAFEDNGNQIYRSDDYKTGVVIEYCATLPATATFDPTRDYKQTTHYENLAAAVTKHLNNETVDLYYYKDNKRRTIQFCDIPTEDLTDHNRVQFGKYIKNAFTVSGTEDEPVYTYTDCNYLLKATAYLVDQDGKVTFSKEPVYFCYKSIASQNSALPEMVENGSN